jgi:4-hydroxybenzoate polyprenyltransferase
VAALFGGGVALFLVAQSHEMVRPLAFPLVLFMLLCLTNCALISTWERDIDETQGQTSLALQFERGAVLIRALPWILAALAPLIIVTRSDAARTVAICVLASTCLLGIVNALERRIGRQLARVLADVVLMTPCLPLVVAWLR